MIFLDAEALRTHSEFAAARNLFARGYVETLSSNKPLVHSTTDEVRQAVGAYVLDRHFTHGAIDQASRVTALDLQSFCTSNMLAGHNRTGSLLGLLREQGYLHQHREAHDRRVKRLEVTQTAIAACKRFLKPLLTALTLLAQTGRSIAQLDVDDRLLAAIAGCWNRYFLEHGPLVNLVPALRPFMTRSAGYEILLKLISTDRPGHVLADRTVHFHYGATADYFGVSRVHVRRLMEDAEAMGYLSLHAPGGRAVQINPPLRQLIDTYISLQLALLLEGVRGASPQSQ